MRTGLLSDNHRAFTIGTEFICSYCWYMREIAFKKVFSFLQYLFYQLYKIFSVFFFLIFADTIDVAECFYSCRLLGGDQVQSLVG